MTVLPAWMVAVLVGCAHATTTHPIAPSATPPPAIDAASAPATPDASTDAPSPDAVDSSRAASSVEPSAPADCGEPAAIAAAIGVDLAAYSVDCESLDGSLVLAATATARDPGAADASTRPPRTVRISVARNGQWLSHTDLHIDATPGLDAESASTLVTSDSWHVRTSRQQLGSESFVRLSVLGEGGDDYYTSSEIAVLLRIAADGTPTVAWTGAGYRLERRMDTCFVERDVTFRLVAPHLLETRFTTVARIHEQRLPADVARRIRRECVASRAAVHRSTLH